MFSCSPALLSEIAPPFAACPAAARHGFSAAEVFAAGGPVGSFLFAGKGCRGNRIDPAENESVQADAGRSPTRPDWGGARGLGRETATRRSRDRRRSRVDSCSVFVRSRGSVESPFLIWLESPALCMEDSNPQHGIKKAIQLPLHALTLTLLVAGLTCAATGAGKGTPFQSVKSQTRSRP